MDQWKEVSRRTPLPFYQFDDRNLARDITVLATVELVPRDYKRKVAWHIIISNTASHGGKYRIDIVFSQNVRVVLKRPILVFNSSYDIPWMELNFERKDHVDVYKSTYTGNIHFSGLRNAVQRHLIQQNNLPNSAQVQNERSVIELLVGFTPILGDLIDIGEFIYASITGRDRWGNHISDEQFLLMALAAILPAVNSSLRNVVNGACDRQAQGQIRNYKSQIEDTWSRQNPLEFRRPGFSAKLDDLLGEDHEIEGAFLELVSSHFSMQGPRDSSLALILS
jgi:hypothetical protein